MNLPGPAPSPRQITDEGERKQAARATTLRSLVFELKSARATERARHVEIGLVASSVALLPGSAGPELLHTVRLELAST